MDNAPNSDHSLEDAINFFSADPAVAPVIYEAAASVNVNDDGTSILEKFVTNCIVVITSFESRSNNK